ncbi:MAG: serine/threonine-protein phosphatase [Chloroflexi bacterium]|nr:serine/threonine-protein phosphatase [Chloroflexota bacterium]
MEATGLSEAGPHRTTNEDSLGAFVPDDIPGAERKGYLYVVADGLGGHQAGEVASATAVKTLRDEYYSPSAHSRIEPALRQAVQAANLRVHDLAHRNPEYRSMATTLTAIALVGNCGYLAHIGDSRAYHWRDGRLNVLTSDHSEAAELVRMRILKPEKVRDHPGRNVLTRTLGHALISRPDFLRQPLVAGDRFLLCSDGLWSEVEDTEIAEAMSDHSPVEACHQLMRLVLARGCPDNASLEMIRVLVTAPPEDPGPSPMGWLSGVLGRGGR